MPNIVTDLRALRHLAAVAGLTVAILFASSLLLAANVDLRARQREQAVAHAEYAQLVKDMLGRTGGEANWDLALQHLDNRFDRGWTAANLTSQFGSDVTNGLVMVLDGNDQVLFAQEQARPAAAARVAAARQAAMAVVAGLRARERPPAAAGRTAADWISASDTVLLQGRPTVVLAAMVGPDTGLVRQLHAHAPILIDWCDVQARIVPVLAERLLLQAISLAPGTLAPPVPRLALTSTTGAPVAWIGWTAEHPGRTLVAGALLPLLALVGILAGTVLVAYRQGVRGQRALHASEARAHHLAYHDALTGLANRRLLTDRIGQAVSRIARHGGSIAVLLLDLDRFKVINDTYGHPCGDELLQEVGRRLQAMCRDEDTCARLGGDEFVVLCVHAEAADAAGFAERLSRAIAAPIRLSGAEVHTAASIGISIGAGETVGDLATTTAADLLRQADLALYKAKEHARGGYRFFEIEMDHALQSRRGLEGDLRQALAHGPLADGSLQVVYQPQFAGDRLAGIEALARWSHPQRGAIPPSVFVPLAEEHGLIEALGAFVLRTAFLDSRRWPGCTIAVNVSAAQLRLDMLVPQIRTLVAETGVDPACVMLEITESVMMAHDRQVRDRLAALREMGFRLALDDFGTGFSSLSYLSRFAVDQIKIDRSFVLGLPGDQVAVSIVRAIVLLAQALDLDVIAEGVETPAQKAVLAELGCTAVQGFLTGRPRPAAQMDVLINAGSGSTSLSGSRVP